MGKDENQKSIFWEELYAAQSPVLYGYLLRKVGPNEAQDILQESFVRLIEAMNKQRPIENYRAYLFQTARHILASHYRERSSMVAQGAPGIPEESGPSAENDTLKKELLDLISQAQQTLSQQEREIFELKWNYGFSQKEIAEVLSKSDRQIRRDLEKIIAKLRSFFTEAGWTLEDFNLNGGTP